MSEYSKTGKPLPAQMLNLFLKRAVEAAILAEDSLAGKRLATTLEKHALRLRMRCGGNSLLETRRSDSPKDQEGSTLQRKRTI